MNASVPLSDLSLSVSETGPRRGPVLAGGMKAVADAVLARWFVCGAYSGPWRAMLLTQNPQGYAGGCTAIAGTDFYTPTSGLRLPTLGIAGTEDRTNPPDLVRETVGLIPDARTELIRRAGHLSCVDRPDAFATSVTGFLNEIGHV